MAKAARKKDPVYDPDSDRPITRPDLRAMEGGGQGDGVPGGNLSSAGSAGEPGGLYNSGGDNSSDGDSSQGENQNENGDSNASTDSKPSSDAVAPDDLESEESTGDPGYASGFDQNNRGTRRQRAGAFAKRNKNKLIWGTAAGGGIFGLIIAGLISLVPLKIENMVNNLQQRFTHPVSSAIETTNRIMLSKYLEKYVIPAYKNCGEVIDKNCKIAISGPGNPVKNTFKAWTKARLDLTLKRDYGIELSFAKNKGRDGVFYLEIAGGRKLDIGPNGEKLEVIFNGTDRSDFSKKLRQQIDVAFPEATKWEKMFLRYKVLGLRAQNHQTKSCIVFCGTRETLGKPRKYLEESAKMYLVERVLKPRGDLVSVALQCIMSENCRPDQDVESTPCTPGEDCMGNGQPTDETERDSRNELRRLAANYGITNTDELFRIYTEMSDEGLQKYMFKTVLTKVFGTTVGSKITNAIPVVGQIQLAAQIVNGLNEAGPKARKLSYMVSAGAAVAQWNNYRTYADEIHTGEVNPVEVGSWADSLGRGEDDPDDPLVGGTASAEESPLYKEIMNNSPTPANSAVASLLGTFFSGKAYAASASAASESPDYKCNDGNTVPVGMLVCSEELIGRGVGGLDAIHDILNSWGWPILKIAQAWKHTVGLAFDVVNGVTGFAGELFAKGLNFAIEEGCGKKLFGVIPVSIPYPYGEYANPVCKVKDLAEEWTPKMVEIAANQLWPSPFGTNMGGGRNFQTAAAGAKVEGDENCDQIGCKVVSDEKVAAIIDEQEAKRRDEFKSESVASRLFNTESQHSLINQVAMATPFDMQGSLQTGFASILSNPLGAVANSFGSAFLTDGSAHAATTSTAADPFNTGSKAFPLEEIPDDPEAYWVEHNCGDESEDGPIAKWQKKSAEDAKNGKVNPTTGTPIHSEVEPCLLIKMVTGVSGGYFDTNLLSEDDLAHINPPGSDSAGSEAGGSEITGEPKQWARELLESGKLTGDPRYIDQIEAVEKGNASCNVNPTILGMLYGVVVKDKHSLYITSLNRYCTNELTASGTGSHHYTEGGGHAVDIGIFDGQTVNGGNAASRKLQEVASKYLPKNTGYGQVLSCKSGFSIPTGSYDVPDECNHQHFQVPVKKLE